MFCSKCGKTVSSTNFCPYCGEPIISSSLQKSSNIGCFTSCLIVFFGLIVIGLIVNAINVISSGPMMYFCIFMTIFSILLYIIVIKKYKGSHKKLIGYGILIILLASFGFSYALQENSYTQQQTLAKQKKTDEEAQKKSSLYYSCVIKKGTLVIKDESVIKKVAAGEIIASDETVRYLINIGKAFVLLEDTPAICDSPETPAILPGTEFITIATGIHRNDSGFVHPTALINKHKSQEKPSKL